MYDKPRFLTVSDHALSVEFSDAIEESTNRKIRALDQQLRAGEIPGMVELVPSYRSLLISYRPEVITQAELLTRLQPYLAAIAESELEPGELIEVPVVYGGEYGPDLPFVAEYHHLTEEQVIELHCAPEYLIYMLGFTLGFPFLGGMDERIATPRLTTPRVKIPGGSVGIAGGQTGIYPVDSPGGWQLIGRTPLKLYDPTRDPAVLFNAGQRIKFYPISAEEYEKMKG